MREIPFVPGMYAYRHLNFEDMSAYKRTFKAFLYAYKRSSWFILYAYWRTKTVCRRASQGLFMPANALYKLRLTQVERAIELFAPLQGTNRPRGGWLRAVREAIGRSVRVQAALVGVSPSTLHKSEVSEAEDRITLGQLRKLASGLDCELVYALVPRQPLQSMVEARAEQVAREEVMSVAHTMALEDQRPSDSYLERKVADRKQQLLARSWARLWR